MAAKATKKPVKKVTGPSPVVHFQIGTQDMKKAKKFYGSLFAWKTDIDPKVGYGMIDAGGGEPDCIDGGLAPEKTPFVTFYVQVPDVRATLKKAVKLGGTVTQEAFEMPGMEITLGMFTDPEGNHIGLLED